MKKNVVFAQLVIFGVISITIIAYTLFSVIGLSPTSNPIAVTVQLKTGGGIFAGSEVAYRGVDVGRVTSVDLHRDGVTIKLSINEGTKIPANSVAHIYDLSVVGEQYVDLVPKRASGPLLAGGDVIPASRTTTPVTTPTVLYDVEQLVKTINPDDVRTVSRELAAAFAGSGPQLRQILSGGSVLVKELAHSKDAMVDLLHNGQILLDTAARHSRDFKDFADSLQALTATLKTSTPTIEKLLEQGAATTRLVNQLITENGSAAAVLMGNLVTFGGIQVATIPGLKALLVAVPDFGRLLPKVVRNGSIQAAALFNYDQQTCAYGVPLTSPISHQRSKLYHVSCPNPTAGELQRGAANVPQTSAGAGTQSTQSGEEQPLVGSTRPTPSGSAQVGTYDPQSGIVVTQNGTKVRLGANGGQDKVLGGRSWESLLIPPGL